MLRALTVGTTLLLQALAAHAQEPQGGSRAGDRYEIRSERLWSRSSGEGSSGSSRDVDVLMERVIAVRDAGEELEFDLPDDATAEDRARTWQFPVRVLRPSQGPLQLLNGAELEARVERWLAAAGWPRAICGRWIFTWNAFRIECDPQSVIPGLARLDLESLDLREGAPYREAGARGPGVLRRETRGSDGAAFVVELEVDPEAVRRERAQNDVVVAEIGRRESLSLDAALQAHSAERISGTIRINFETDAAGRVRRRRKVTELAIEGPDGGRETQTFTDTVERRLVSRAAP
ncbi:MAG: hypothetical protein QOH47_2830 [Sphingomonadales bacterium]|jgi:hypothetical protein|nr:hypothetical protein [Sphingomonadales bacterium]